MGKIVKSYIFPIVTLSLGLSVLFFQTENTSAQNAASGRSGSVLLNNNRADKGDDPFILQAKLIEEKQGTLLFEISYFMSDTIDGSYSLSIHPNKCDWSYDANTLRPGVNVLKMLLSFRPKTDEYEECQSSILHMYISRYHKNVYIGKVFDRTIEFSKTWARP